MTVKVMIDQVRNAIHDADSTLPEESRSSLEYALQTQTDLLAAIDALIGERDEVVSNISALKRVLAIGEAKTDEMRVSEPGHLLPRRSALADMPVWRQAESVLRETEHSMTVREITEAIKIRGGDAGKAPEAGITNGMKRYLDRVFTKANRDGTNVYGLREWEGRKR